MTKEKEVLQGAPSAQTLLTSELLKECPHGKVLFCPVCRPPPSEEVLEMARKAIAARDARTTQVKGGPCPCGRGPAGSECGGAFPNGRYECNACVEDSIQAGVAFIMDTSFGGD